jgi:hypothetical protein
MPLSVGWANRTVRPPELLLDPPLELLLELLLDPPLELLLELLLDEP